MRHLLLKLLPAFALILFATLNTAQTIHFGRSSLGLDGGTLKIVQGPRLSDFRALENLPTSNQDVLVGLADIGVRVWAEAFLGTPGYHFPEGAKFPSLYDPRFHYVGGIDYATFDSTPLSCLPDCSGADGLKIMRRTVGIPSNRAATYLLDWNTATDLGWRPRSMLWHSGPFALRNPVPADFVTIGRGWYRSEHYPRSPERWQQQPFRWVRKRAELFVLNPTGTAKRLHLTLVAGFGSPSQERHIKFLLNGMTIDSITVLGYRELYTHPFVINGSLGQLELAIEEDVQPIPRPVALWNKWVPMDPRRLNVAVAGLELLEANSPVVNHREAFVDFNNAAAATPVNGIYPDHWLAREAEVELQAPQNSNCLVLNGSVPQVPGYQFPMPLEIGIGDYSLNHLRIEKPGDFHLTIPLPAALLAKLNTTKATRVTIRPSATFVPAAVHPSPDTRRISFRISYIGFQGSAASLPGSSMRVSASARPQKIG